MVGTSEGANPAILPEGGTRDSRTERTPQLTAPEAGAETLGMDSRDLRRGDPPQLSAGGRGQGSRDPRQSEPRNSALREGSEVLGKLWGRPRHSAEGRGQGSLGGRANPATSLLRGPDPRGLGPCEPGVARSWQPRPSASSPAGLRNPAPRGARPARGPLSWGRTLGSRPPALTCAAITRCLSAIRLHFLHWQSRHMQKRLWPLSGDA